MTVFSKTITKTQLDAFKSQKNQGQRGIRRIARQTECLRCFVARREYEAEHGLSSHGSEAESTMCEHQIMRAMMNHAEADIAMRLSVLVDRRKKRSDDCSIKPKPPALSSAAIIRAAREHKQQKAEEQRRMDEAAKKQLAEQRRRDPELKRRKEVAETTLTTGTLAARIHPPSCSTSSTGNKVSSRSSSTTSTGPPLVAMATSPSDIDSDSGESSESDESDEPLVVPESTIHKHFNPAKWPQLVMLHTEMIKAVLHNPMAFRRKSPRMAKLKDAEKTAVRGCFIFLIHKGSQSIKLLAHRRPDGGFNFLRVIVSEHLGNQTDTARRQYQPPANKASGVALSVWLKEHKDL